MTVETFFEKFELFAAAPAAVEKMRESVLRLAIRGELLQARHAEESAGDFLKRIWTDANDERTKLEDVQRLEPFLLPPQWEWTVLGEIASFMIGKTPPRGGADFWSDGVHPWVSIADMTHYGTITSTKELVSEVAAQEVFRMRLAPVGSILMSFKLTIGKVARTAIACFHNEAIISLHPPEQELREYLFRFLPLFAKLQTSNNAIKGNTLNKELLNSLPVALPPLAEQKRIVAKVDELMALCDRLEAQQKEREAKHAHLARAALARFAEAPTPANLEYLFHHSFHIDPGDLRKSILTMAVQGKLESQRPDDVPIARWVKQVGIETASGPSDLPRSWAWLVFSSIFDCAGGIQKTPARTPRRNAFPYVGVSNVQRGRLDLANVKQFELEDGELERRRLLPNDLLIVEGNGSADEIGRCAKWLGEVENCVHQNHVHRCRPIAAELSDYVLLVLNSPYGIAMMQSLAITSSGLYSLSLGKIRQLLVPLPPLAEQRRIVAKVDQLMALVDRLEAQLAESRSLGERLMEAVVAELTNPSPVRVEVKAIQRVADAGRFACYVVWKWAALGDAGRTKLEKATHFAQYHCGVPIDRHAVRYKRGPVDYELLKSAETWAGEHGGFTTNDPGNNERVVYTPGPALADRVKEAEALIGEHKAEVDRVLNLLAPLSTHRCGLIATAYTAWNDLLIAGEKRTDRDIIREARHHWHETKEKIADKDWFWAIRFLEMHGIEPKGRGPSLRPQ